MFSLPQDDVFEAKEEIASNIKEELTKCMTGYGFSILHALVTDIEPANKVKEVRTGRLAVKCGKKSWVKTARSTVLRNRGVEVSKGLRPRSKLVSRELVQEGRQVISLG